MTNKLYCGDVMGIWRVLGERTPLHCLIADPPDNIGLGYASYDDKKPDMKYREWLSSFICMAVSYSPISWLSFNAKWIFDVGKTVANIRDSRQEHKMFIQSFTFGQNQQADCGSGYRPILRVRDTDAPLYPDAIRVPSWRMQKGDKRADPRGRVPLDVWDQHFGEEWKIPRVTGNSKQRRAWHPTQLNEDLVRRMILMSTKDGDTILDCFSGTGTVLRAAKDLDRHIISVDIDPIYCQKIADEHGITYETI